VPFRSLANAGRPRYPLARPDDKETQTMGPLLITGGAGFIGSHLIDALLGAGQAVVVDARLPAVLVAAGLLVIRVPFLVVVVAAAATAALLRLWGWAA
jgi:short-subunit dehydrogenase involved in D-alanine esterification of teichoic acids